MSGAVLEADRLSIYAIVFRTKLLRNQSVSPGRCFLLVMLDVVFALVSKIDAAKGYQEHPSRAGRQKLLNDIKASLNPICEHSNTYTSTAASILNLLLLQLGKSNQSKCR